ncbi:DUF4573 domain-containing protein [Vibrio paucivorans]|uniref:Glutamate-rich protein 5 n=1 Tax=Vibrio paucivorans TaxID=2829489 RepID=A0A9X3CJP2_9VIBR|nr:DUF4573 domain-containing protein [Vibrio paucivorans]MCW8336050.1 glutamate-rich protein 5 [Vibrio paucivorans]
MKRTLLSVLMLSAISQGALANSSIRSQVAQDRLDNYSEADLSREVFGKPYSEFLEKVVFINSIPEGARLIKVANAESCNGIYDFDLCMEFAPTAAGIQQDIVQVIIDTPFPSYENDRNPVGSPIVPIPVSPKPPSVTPQLPDLRVEPIDPGYGVEPIDPGYGVEPIDPGYGVEPIDPGYGVEPIDPGYGVEPIDPGYGVEPIDPGYGVEPIDPGYGIEPIGEEEQMPTIGLGAFRAMTLEEQAQVLTEYVNNNNSSSNGSVVVVGDKLMWQTKNGTLKPLKESNKILEVLEDAHLERQARRDERIKVDPIDIIVEPIDPGFGVDPLPPYDENAPIIAPVIWGKNIATIKSWTGAINPASLESYKAMIAMANSPEGKIATLKMMLVNEISTDNILKVLATNEKFVRAYPHLFNGVDRFGNPIPSKELELIVQAGREKQWQKQVNSYYSSIADIYDDIEEDENKLKFATLLDSLMIGGSNKSLLEVMQGNGYLQGVPSGGRDRDLANEILEKAKQHWQNNTTPGGIVITDTEKQALALHRIFSKAGMTHLHVSVHEENIQVFNQNNGKLLNEKQIMTKLTKAAGKNASQRQQQRGFEARDHIKKAKQLDASEQVSALNDMFQMAGFDAEAFHNQKDGHLAIVTKDGTVYTVIPTGGNGEKSGTVEQFKLKVTQNLSSADGQQRRSERREQRHKNYKDRTPNHKSKFDGKRLKEKVAERRNVH